MVLVVVEDRHADAALRRVLASARAANTPVVVLTADALLMMQLRRDGIDARLPLDAFTRDAESHAKIDQRDAVALGGVASAVGAYARFGATNFAPYLEYTLIPSFVRAVRNVAGVQDVVASMMPQRMVLVGGGALVQAAQLVGDHRTIPIERAGGDVLTRAWHALARLRAGRATRWVNTEFRALVLEPGFLSLLFVKGVWRRLAGPPSPPIRADALVVVGDRFTADVVDRLRGEVTQILLAGATQPGRAMFARFTSLVAIESFARWGDSLASLAACFEAAGRAISLLTDREHARAFTVDDVCYWRLVGRAAALHVLIWTPALRHLDRLAERASAAAPHARLLVSSDVTAATRVLVDAVRRHGVPSIAIQHGITAEPNGHAIVHADTLATWGEQTEEWYRFEAAKRGRQQTARFVVTGNPRYDSLAARRGNPRSQVPTIPFTICVCTGFLTDFSTAASDYDNLLMIGTVLGWARAYPDVRVVHKIHPGEELEYYAHAARVLAWDALKITTVSDPILHDILQQSHALVTSYSSTVLESLALGTPVIVFDAITRRSLIKTPLHPLESVPGVSIAYSLEQLGELLDDVKRQPQIDRVRVQTSAELRAFVSDLDGEAAARVAALVRRP